MCRTTPPSVPSAASSRQRRGGAPQPINSTIVTNLLLFFQVSLNGTQFTDSSVGSEFTGVSQTPFTFGLGQRAPYTTGEHCLLCRSERKDTSLSESGIKNSSKTALSTSPKANNMLHLPLWVCPDCRRTVEKEERHATIEQSLVSQDFLSRNL
ncbi:uncharacterized protein LOC106631899 [Geospiza fortis]|uniref:Uncharacterized protein LOC106631899 n=1 Tax=Geospiza fortis TaxID=48883 RepID=A0A8N5EWT5_GEOFO|nr:uncharacterized protein LOC106631899 [Geospiza fortis]